MIRILSQEEVKDSREKNQILIFYYTRLGEGIIE